MNASDPAATTPLQDQAAAWFEDLRNQLCAAFEAIEDEGCGTGLGAAESDAPPGRFARTRWERDPVGPGDTPQGGGGTMAVMRGRVFEKVGVNVSVVHGSFAPEFAASMPGAAEDPRYWAAGVSLVAHMRSPLIPAAHFNTRMIRTSKAWFGGGGDLNPTFPVDEDTAYFHQAFKTACDKHDPAYYPKFKAWCDEYFFNKHRNAPRGVGGIFYDNHNSGDLEADFAFTQDVGRAFLESFPAIIRRRKDRDWTAEQRQALRVKRGHYAEFNLIYDRGTIFGLKTGGNVDAILMSLPPDTAWP